MCNNKCLNATAYLSGVSGHVQPFTATVWWLLPAGSHTAGIISSRFLERDTEFTVLKRPQSPDHSPIENLWDVLEQEIHIIENVAVDVFYEKKKKRGRCDKHHVTREIKASSMNNTTTQRWASPDVMVSLCSGCSRPCRRNMNATACRQQRCASCSASQWFRFIFTTGVRLCAGAVVVFMFQAGVCWTRKTVVLRSPLPDVTWHDAHLALEMWCWISKCGWNCV